ncbi:MAG: sulfatase-like hydrolase/transferase [Oscillochloris sp.]|nr:sulfatase-like hydrolase/transferase [Oscillochloris sp.]
MDRRTFLKRLAIGGATLAAATQLRNPHLPAVVQATDDRPNILIILVDQMRYPQWFPAQSTLDTYLPGLARLRNGAVAFGSYYTAASACSPARAALLTGLYCHQTYCLRTISNPRIPELHRGFPTYGSFLRNHGYQTYWFGKWHLGPTQDLEPYGFSGGTFPSPNGGPSQGMTVDSQISDQFLNWLKTQSSGPWCTTVSLVNPHDIAWYWRFTQQIDRQAQPEPIFTQLPANFETPAQHSANNKPRLQVALRRLIALFGGYIPFGGPGFPDRWLRMLDMYLFFHQIVDAQITRLLDALAAHPRFGSNTIIIFSSDHGEYAGSHGLRNKGSAAYEEGIRVPLYVKDPTGRYTGAPELERPQLCSSVDIAPLLLTIAPAAHNGAISLVMPILPHAMISAPS